MLNWNTSYTLMNAVALCSLLIIFCDNSDNDNGSLSPTPTETMNTDGTPTPHPTPTITVTATATLTPTPTPTINTFYHTYGGNDDEYGYAVELAHDDGYIIAGRIYYSNDVWDAYIMKTDTHGSIEWEKLIGGPWEESFKSIIKTNDGAFAAAGLKSSSPLKWNYYLVKLDQTGEILWEKTYDSGDLDDPQAMIQTNDGGYMIVGYSSSEPHYNSSDIFIVKTDAEGNELWSKLYDFQDHDMGYSIIETSDGGYLISSQTAQYGDYFQFQFIRLNNQGDLLWEKRYGSDYYDLCVDIKATSDDGFILSGYTEYQQIPAGSGLATAYAVKIDQEGNTLWENTYGLGIIQRIIVRDDGSFILIGWDQKADSWNNDITLFRIDAYGSIIEQNTILTDTVSERAWDVKETPDNGLIYCGYTQDLSTLNVDLLVLKTDQQGNL